MNIAGSLTKARKDYLEGNNLTEAESEELAAMLAAAANYQRLEDIYQKHAPAKRESEPVSPKGRDEVLAHSVHRRYCNSPYYDAAPTDLIATLCDADGYSIANTQGGAQ